MCILPLNIISNKYFFYKSLLQKQNTALMILLWHLVNNLMYFLLLEESFLDQYINSKSLIYTFVVEAVLTLLSPLAGSLADLKFGRFNVMIWSTYAMAVFECLCSVVLVIISAIVEEVNTLFYLMIVFFVVTSAGYYIGRVFFLTNVIQFGTDQLRDSPTQHSIMFIHLFFWFENLSHLIGKVISSLPRHETVLDAYHKIANINSTQFLIFEVCLCLSATLSILVIVTVQKYSSSFLKEKIVGNPYKLAFRVIKFAIKHKKPIKRSAFTYCGDEHPSRIDYGKQIYGGPFTTEQVEDIKSFLRMAVVLFFAGPSLMLQLNSNVIIIHHGWVKLLSKQYYSNILFNRYIIPRIFVFVSIPSYIIFVRPYFSRWIPNMFKRIGLGMFIMNLFFLLHFIYISAGVYDNYNARELQCYVNTSYMPYENLVLIPNISLQIFNEFFSPLYEMLFYISVWEFICSQSPQYMKGLLFGWYYSIQAVFRLMATAFLIFFHIPWKPITLNCQLYNILFNFIFGVISLCVYTVLSRQYKYRKRDDICNVYKYAEDYYSNIQ